MIELKTINKQSDLENCSIKSINWDFEYEGMPYQIVRIGDYYHCDGGRYGENNLYAYPLGEEMTFDNLIAFGGNAPCWGVTFEEGNYHRNKWNCESIEQSSTCWITRNGKNFYPCYGRDMGYALSKAQYFMVRLHEETPVCLGDRNWEEELIGSKVYWEGQPAIVDRVHSPESIFLVPDGAEYFVPNESDFNGEDDIEYEKKCWQMDYGKSMGVDILSPNVRWFRS